MSLLVIGLSHHTAPLAVLEALAEHTDRSGAIATAALSSATATEVVVLSTCNRLEVYAEVPAFHPAVAAIGEALALAAGVSSEPPSPAPADDLPHRAEVLADHLYVRHDEGAVAHAFTVACGLDSMAVGEAQVLGQMRDALATAQANGQVGESLNALFQQALRVGKRAHSETDIDQHSVSLVHIALEQAALQLGDLTQRSAAVIGAGSMSGLAAATTRRAGIGSLTIANRTPERAARLAEATQGDTRPWAELPDVVAESDLVITCTGAVGHVITGEIVARSARLRDGRPQVVVDLALPRDVEPAESWTSPTPGVTLVDLQHLGRLLEGRADRTEVGRVGALVTAEVADYLTRRMEKSVTPTVAALRARAASLVAAEMERLDQRLPHLDEQTRAEVALAVHRVVEKLLHTPTRRVKEFAMEGSGDDYAAALRELFDLEPKDVANVSTPPKRVGP
ncbi:glutamyl-tRNA reductase [Humibacillus xanthopallidus]|uniref:Glutamyl-tRNA reductase n=1 Tax=Humibacillus xanthopallidus TaxID=412689 RepID=A0A543PMY3_9MICO|nr:glutamyl-tRNA reductase [Humibacillus xanthopallidus]TQN45419.1 glutamyl-tRNA reductase [Humibacillus xanthopallidus]